MYDVLNDLGGNIQQFLEAVLPSCDGQWWDAVCIVHPLVTMTPRQVSRKTISVCVGVLTRYRLC